MGTEYNGTTTLSSVTGLIRVNIAAAVPRLLIRHVCILLHRVIHGCRNRGNQIAMTNEILNRDAYYV
jgi:hypothetical protein